jgi:hypothetical protein
MEVKPMSYVEAMKEALILKRQIETILRLIDDELQKHQQPGSVEDRIGKIE